MGNPLLVVGSSPVGHKDRRGWRGKRGLRGDDDDDDDDN